MNQTLRTVVLAGVTGAAVLGSGAAVLGSGAGPAYADDASYLAALDAQGLFSQGPPNARLSAGHKFCGELRAGSSPDEIAAFHRGLPSFGVPTMIDQMRSQLPALINVAQHELCPDTLPPPG